MSHLVYIKKEVPNNKKLELFDVGRIIEINDDSMKIEFLRIDLIIVLSKEFIDTINISNTGDRFEYKVCDRCFKYLKTETLYENNRLKKGDVITKRPSCRDCRKIKNGKNVSTEDRKKWELLKPKIGEIFICPICRKKSIGGISKHVLDHNHSSGEVRGYLCESCNTGIGRFDDDSLIIKNAIDWIGN